MRKPALRLVGTLVALALVATTVQPFAFHDCEMQSGSAGALAFVDLASGHARHSAPAAAAAPVQENDTPPCTCDTQCCYVTVSGIPLARLALADVPVLAFAPLARVVTLDAPTRRDHVIPFATAPPGLLA